MPIELGYIENLDLAVDFRLAQQGNLTIMEFLKEQIAKRKEEKKTKSQSTITHTPSSSSASIPISSSTSHTPKKLIDKTVSGKLFFAMVYS